MSLAELNNVDSFFVTNDDGTVTECDILFSLDDGEDGMFIVFTDGSRNEYGRVRAFAGLYNPASCENMLLPIENETDMNYIASALKYINTENRRRDKKRRRRGVDVYGSRYGRSAWRHKSIFAELFTR